MPLNLSNLNIIDYKTFIIRNKTSRFYSVGDLNIVLNPNGVLGDSINLLERNALNKKTYRNFKEISESNDLRFAISSDSIEIETESGILSGEDRFNSLNIARVSDIEMTGVVRTVNFSIPTDIWTSEVIDVQVNLGPLSTRTEALLGFFNGNDKETQAKQLLSANKFITDASGITTTNPYFWANEVLGTNTYSYIKVYEDYRETSLSFETYSQSGFSPTRMFKVVYPGTSYTKILGSATATTDGFKYSHSAYGILVGYNQAVNTGVFGLNKRVQLVTAWLEQSGLDTICVFRFHNIDHPTGPTVQVDMTIAIYE